jgi:glycosyltransferase involved in cell wall biosynthesis
MSKVYFVGGQYMGCWYVRCLLPMIANGWLGNYWGLEKKIKPVEMVRQEMSAADIIVFHRANTIGHHKTAMILKQMGKKIVFDNDDTYIIDKSHAFYGLDERGFKENTKKVNNIINNFIINSDLVTCSTEYLAKEYRKLNPNVKVLPNLVNPDDWDKPLRNEGDKVRIGVVGSVAYYHDFQIVEDVLKKLDNDPRVQLVLFGLNSKKQRETNKLTNEVHKREYSFWDTLKNTEHAPWCSMEDYFRVLNELRLDIMMIPRKDSYFNKCKSNVKFLEASMLEIPVITNYFKDCPYEKDGDYLVWAKDWLKDLEKLIVDKKLRRDIGKKAKKYVLSNYNINNKGYLWKDAYKNLL